jgi:ClpX C4-type zinc finger
LRFTHKVPCPRIERVGDAPVLKRHNLSRAPAPRACAEAVWSVASGRIRHPKEGGRAGGVALVLIGSEDGLLCLFCGRVRTGGVAGPTPDIYICPDCIRLAAEILDEQDFPTEA